MMPDREKVIKGLECCFNPHSEHSCLCRCADCPYNPPEDDDWNQQCQIELNRDALALLKEQEAASPYQFEDIWKCGNCVDGVVAYEELGVSGIEEVKFNYCPTCGRRVLWGGR